MENDLITLGLESSCDETAAAVLRGRFEVLSSVVASQHEIHNKYGGVVPELACRRHAEVIRPVTREALDRAGIDFGDIGLIAVTRGPGLVGALLVGLSYAKALAFGKGLPLVGVNHLEGHVASAFVTWPDIPTPTLALVASGGHTELFLANGPYALKWLGGTRDDAAGETFDKVAKELGLGYPGGPLVEKMAAKGKSSFNVPVGMAGSDMPDFSFSGPKTAVKHIIHGFRKNGKQLPVADICSSFQKSIIDALEMKIRLAAQMTGPRSLAITGGVACNGALRKRMEELGEELGIPVVIPAPDLCSDNAVMIAVSAANRFMDDPESPVWMDYLEMDANPSWLPDKP